MKIKHVLVFSLILIVALMSVNAQWIESLDCAKLDNSLFVPKTEFEAPADICFYGTGYPGDVKVILDGDTDYSKDAGVSNGILTSVNNVRFEDVPEGNYRLLVETQDGNFEYYKDIQVVGEQSQIPEFSGLAAALAMLGAGYFIMRKRGAK